MLRSIELNKFGVINAFYCGLLRHATGGSLKESNATVVRMAGYLCGIRLYAFVVVVKNSLKTRIVSVCFFVSILSI